MRLVFLFAIFSLAGAGVHAFGRELRGDVAVSEGIRGSEATAARNLVFECFYLFPDQPKKLKGIEHLIFQSLANSELTAAGTCVFETAEPSEHQ